MRDQTESQSVEQAEARDPYGDVALGVECAWPHLIPVEHAEHAEFHL
jgi:hypothetical protein